MSETAVPSVGASPSAAADNPLTKTIADIGRALAALDPGTLADLRREPADAQAPRPAYFYRLAARHKIRPSQEDDWLRIIRIMAILTAKGAPEGKPSPHAGTSKGDGLGAALCDGGDPAWGRGELKPRAFLSELRFARLLAAKGEVRAGLMERAARALAANKPARAGVDCVLLAWFLLVPDDPGPARQLARQYYARLDRATAASTDDTADPEISPGDDA